MQIPKTARGMQIAVLLVQQQNPSWNNKQIASLFNLSTRRIQQIKKLLEEMQSIS